MQYFQDGFEVMPQIHVSLLQKRVTSMNDEDKLVGIETFQDIENKIKSNDVVLFMKGTPTFPSCGFSASVTNILTKLGVKFSSVNILDSDEIREGVKIFSDWPTIPQLYVKEEFIGGCDIVTEMYESGELIKLFNSKKI